MKCLIAILLCFLFAYCSEPLPITTQPDEHNTTNGTVGSSPSTYQMPRKPVDSTYTIDTSAIKKEGPPVLK